MDVADSLGRQWERAVRNNTAPGEDPGECYVTILRDPRDVAVSSCYHLLKIATPTSTSLCQRTFVTLRTGT